MNGATSSRTVRATFPSAPANPLAVAPGTGMYAAVPAVHTGPLAVRPRAAAAALRFRGEVSPRPEGSTTLIAMVDGPTIDHKCTGASVPGRRGGT